MKTALRRYHGRMPGNVHDLIAVAKTAAANASAAVAAGRETAARIAANRAAAPVPAAAGAATPQGEQQPA